MDHPGKVALRPLDPQSRPTLSLLAAGALALLAGCGPVDGFAAGTAANRPGHLVTLNDGRHINLRCSGHGSPTVLFESGFGANSTAWGKVQAKLAQTTRTCAYDRAGYDFSDPGPLPRDGAAIARDLDQALTNAGEAGPFILVGHSAGGLYARLFAARRLSDVEGLVLLDPTVEHRAPRPDRDGLDGIRRRILRCLATAEASPKPPLGDPSWTGCISPKASAHAAMVAQSPDAWRQQLSELNEIFGRTSDQVMRLGDLLRPIPLYVITASDTAAASPTVGYDKPQSIWELQHIRLALNSEHGSQRTVLSSHLIMIDRPEVVIDAVLAMVQAARAGEPPEPLPSSETAPSGTGSQDGEPFGLSLP